MILNEHVLGDATVVEVVGRIDSPNAPQLHQRLESLMVAGKPVVILDLAKVEYITSAGFRVLLLLARQAGKLRCRFVLCSVNGKVRQLFDLGGFLDLFPIVATREEGIAAAQ